MAQVRREELKSRDATEDALKAVAGLVKESYLGWFELTTSFWEKNLKAVSGQLDRWVALQGEYVNFMKYISERQPKEVMRMWSEGLKPLSAQTDWLSSLQKDSLGSLRDSSDRFTKDLLSLNRTNIEKALSAFDSYINILR